MPSSSAIVATSPSSTGPDRRSGGAANARPPSERRIWINPAAHSFADLGDAVRVTRGDVTQFDEVMAAFVDAKPDRAINLSYLLGDHPPHVRRPGHIGSDRGRASARGDDRPLRVFRARLVAVVIYGHCRAGFSERNSGGATDAGTCARD